MCNDIGDTDDDQCKGCWRYAGPNEYCIHCGWREMDQDGLAVATPDPEETWFAEAFHIDTEGAHCHTGDTSVGRGIDHIEREYECSFTVCIEDDDVAERLREMFGGGNSGGESANK